jgi:hypothetical protein
MLARRASCLGFEPRTKHRRIVEGLDDVHPSTSRSAIALA